MTDSPPLPDWVRDPEGAMRRELGEDASPEATLEWILPKLDYLDKDVAARVSRLLFGNLIQRFPE